VGDATRTRDRLDHNQELYQLSYAHRGGLNLAARLEAVPPEVLDAAVDPCRLPLSAPERPLPAGGRPARLEVQALDPRPDYGNQLHRQHLLAIEVMTRAV
jgi:hypothetical protein